MGFISSLFDTAELVEDIPSNWDPRTGPDPNLKRMQAMKVRV